MKKSLISLFWVMLFSMMPCGCENSAETSSAEAAKPAAAVEKSTEPAIAAHDVASATTPVVIPDKVVVYYFHGDYRCPTCTKMEALADKTIKERFAAELASGKLEWKVVNVDLEENKHFSKDYQLYTKSLIVSAVKGDAQIKWKNCEKIWAHVRNPPEYEDYVYDEIKAFLSGV